MTIYVMMTQSPGAGMTAWPAFYGFINFKGELYTKSLQNPPFRHAIP